MGPKNRDQLKPSATEKRPLILILILIELTLNIYTHTAPLGRYYSGGLEDPPWVPEAFITDDSSPGLCMSQPYRDTRVPIKYKPKVANEFKKLSKSRGESHTETMEFIMSTLNADAFWIHKLTAALLPFTQLVEDDPDGRAIANHLKAAFLNDELKPALRLAMFNAVNGLPQCSKAHELTCERCDGIEINDETAPLSMAKVGR